MTDRLVTVPWFDGLRVRDPLPESRGECLSHVVVVVHPRDDGRRVPQRCAYFVEARAVLEIARDEGVSRGLVPREVEAKLFGSLLPAGLDVLLAIAGPERRPAAVLRLGGLEGKNQILAVGAAQLPLRQMDLEHLDGVDRGRDPLELAAPVLVLLER